MKTSTKLARKYWLALSVSKVLVAVQLLHGVVGLEGCGGGSAASPPISVTISPLTGTVVENTSVTFTATVLNDPTSEGVTWRLTGGILPGGKFTCGNDPVACGFLSNPTATSITYIAPSGPLPTTAEVIATSVADSTKSANVSLNVVPPPSITLTVTTSSLPNGTVNVPYTATFQSSGGTPPVTWSLGTGTALSPGLSLSSTGTISGMPTSPGSSCFIATAIDSSTPPQDASRDLCIGINSADSSHNAFLKGHYAFVTSGFGHLSGLSVPVQVATAGSFVADGMGNITGGVSDTNASGGVTANQPFAGTYALGSDNRGIMSINSSVAATVTLAFSVGSISSGGVATKGRIINFATSGIPTAGEFELQDTTAFSNSAISGSYAFGLSGWGVIDKQFGADGVFTADGGGNVSSGNADTYQKGTFASSEALTGTYSLAPGSTTGRGTGSLTIAGATLNMTFYVVSASKLFIVSAEQAINPDVFIGQALKQFGRPFSNSSLNSASVFIATGTGAVHDVTAGLATFNGNGSVTFLEDQNNAGSITLGGTATASYSVASNGRVTVTEGGSTASVLYLVRADEGFILNTDSRTGSFEPQAPGPFTDSSTNGSFFLGDVPPSCCTAVSSGVAALNAGTIDQTSDISNGSLTYGQTSMDAYTVSANGRAITTSGNDVIYIVSPTKFVVVDINPAVTRPSIRMAQQ